MAVSEYLGIDGIYCGRAEDLLKEIAPESISLSIWSPPYHVGKGYEDGQSYGKWQEMLRSVIGLHRGIIKPGGFLAVNINDILCFPDASMPRFLAKNVSSQRCGVTEEDVRAARAAHPEYGRRQLAALLGCSEQTVDRRLHGNNIRGGKHAPQTRVKLAGGFLEETAYGAGLYLYDRRIWQKDPAWASSRWTMNSYRAADEFEYLYIFWKPGPTKVDRNRLCGDEWREWGSRGVWSIRSVPKNDDHEAKFPLELPRRAIRLLTDEDDVVLDCFIGSGTTAMAALTENRHYIGIEKEEKYVRLARENIESFKMRKERGRDGTGQRLQDTHRSADGRAGLGA